MFTTPQNRPTKGKSDKLLYFYEVFGFLVWCDTIKYIYIYIYIYLKKLKMVKTLRLTQCFIATKLFRVINVITLIRQVIIYKACKN